MEYQDTKYQFKGYIRSQVPLNSMTLYSTNQRPNMAMILSSAENEIMVRNAKFVVSYIENGLVGINCQKSVKNSDRNSAGLVTRLKKQGSLLKWDSANSHPRLGGLIRLVWEITTEPTLKQKFSHTCVKVMAV